MQYDFFWSCTVIIDILIITRVLMRQMYPRFNCKEYLYLWFYKTSMSCFYWRWFIIQATEKNFKYCVTFELSQSSQLRQKFWRSGFSSWATFCCRSPLRCWLQIIGPYLVLGTCWEKQRPSYFHTKSLDHRASLEIALVSLMHRICCDNMNAKCPLSWPVLLDFD